MTYRDARVRQQSWARIYLAPSYNRGATKHAYALQVLEQILGDSATSRLYRRLVVERKLAAGAGAGYSPMRYDLGTFYVYASPRSGVTLARIEKAVEQEIAKLLQDGVSGKEVKRAISSLQAAAIYARDNLRSGAMAFGVALTTGRSVADVEAWPARIGKVTVADVNAAARFVFNNRRSVTAILLPPKKKQASAPSGKQKAAKTR